MENRAFDVVTVDDETTVTDLFQIPPPAKKRIALQVTPSAERIIRRGHPWLFDQAIREQSQAGNPGDLAVIFDNQRKFLAIGLYDPTAAIRVRILQHRNPAIIAGGFFAARLKAAAQIRGALPENTTGYRLVHGENDQLPGLVIDRYAQTLVIKLYTLAWIPHLRDILTGLNEIRPYERVVLRLSRTVCKFPEYLFGLQDGSILVGSPLRDPLIFLENGIRCEADPIQGQKTGFFLDQRDNRAKVEQLAEGKSVLNLFAYSGGFSIYAARGGSPQVTSVDISRPALETAQRIFKRNADHSVVAACQHETIAGDVFQVLEHLKVQGRKFDIVIIDPPSFANRRDKIDQALGAYQQLTRLGLKTLKPGGILVQASCSSRVSAGVFFEAILEAAARIGRPLTEMERTYHGLDHPIGFTEGAYLKCLFAKS